MWTTTPERHASRGSSLYVAVADVAAVGPGMALLGVSFGVLAVSSGLSWWWAPLCSAVIYAGSLEFLLVPLVLAHTSLGAVALTAALVNARHVFYGLSFPLHRVRGTAARAYSIFALIDEAYALLSEHCGAAGHARILSTQLLLHGSWLGGVVVGTLVSSGFRFHLPALDFVFIGLFVVLALDSTRESGELVTPLTALAAALAALWIAPAEMVLVGLTLVVALLLARYYWNRGGSAHG